jgi:hypothetical protein
VFIDEQTSAFFADLVKGELELRATVAAKTVEDIASETLGMYPNERRIARDVSHTENNGFFDAGGRVPLEAIDPEVAETAREIGFRDFLKLYGRSGGHQLSNAVNGYTFIIMFGRPRWWNNT